MSDPTELKARILAMTRTAPSPTRGETSANVWLVLLSGAIVGAALYFAFDGPRHGEGREAWFYASSALGWLAVASLALWGALARGGSAVGRPRLVLLAIAVGTPALLFAMMFGFAVAHPELTLIHPERAGLKCMGLTIAAAALPLVGLARVRRASDPVHPVATGAALGAACGASAGVTVVMWCPVAAPMHVVIGHIAPLVALTVVGALLGSRTIAMSGPLRKRDQGAPSRAPRSWGM